MNYAKAISPEQTALMAPDSKIGVLATLSADAYPHLTFISSLQGLGENGMSFGKFSVGFSKKYIEERPDVGFLILTTDMSWLSGNAHFSHTENTGALFDEYNAKPLFRYNTYFGFDHVYVLDLVRISVIQKLFMPAIITGAVLSRVASVGIKRNGENKLRIFGTALAAELDSLKFVSWQGEDGLLQIVPIIQAGVAGSDRIIFSGLPYGDQLKALKDGTKAAILCVNLDMQSVEAEGIIHRHAGARYLEIERVYNSMPPKMEYIYPRATRPQAVTEFFT